MVLDPVADIESGVLAGLLDGADHVAGHAFGFQLRGDLGVEDHEAAAGQDGRCAGSLAFRGFGHDGFQGVLLRLEVEAAGGDHPGVV